MDFTGIATVEDELFDLAGRFEVNVSDDSWFVEVEDFSVATGESQWPDTTLRVESSTDPDGDVVVLAIDAKSRDEGWEVELATEEAWDVPSGDSIDGPAERIRAYLAGRFADDPGAFLLEGARVTLVRPAPMLPGAPTRSASGSVFLADAVPQVARASRIWVEGSHDAELVERVWGHDLRVAGIVVEPLHGADHLLDALARLPRGTPRPARRRRDRRQPGHHPVPGELPLDNRHNQSQTAAARTGRPPSRIACHPGTPRRCHSGRKEQDAG